MSTTISSIPGLPHPPGLGLQPHLPSHLVHIGPLCGQQGEGQLQLCLPLSLSEDLQGEVVGNIGLLPDNCQATPSALQLLEGSAISDAAVREKIAKLPPELVQLVQLESASNLLTKYNKRLQEELRDRTRGGKMVADFLSAQKDLSVQVDQIFVV